MSFFNREDRIVGPRWHDYYSDHFIEATYKTPVEASKVEQLSGSVSQTSSINPSSRLYTETQTSDNYSESQFKRKTGGSFQEISSKRLCQESGTGTETDQPKIEKTAWTTYQVITLLKIAGWHEKKGETIHYGQLAKIIGHSAKECEETYTAIKFEELKREWIDPDFKLGSEKFLVMRDQSLSENEIAQVKEFSVAGIPLSRIAVILGRSLPALKTALDIKDEVPAGKDGQPKLSPFLTFIFEKKDDRLQPVSEKQLSTFPTNTST